jgi:hypothetical protein
MVESIIVKGLKHRKKRERKEKEREREREREREGKRERKIRATISSFHLLLRF